MLRGEAHLIFRDINTGDITKEVREKNTITETMLNRMAGADPLDANGGYGRFGDHIMIGGWNQETDRNNYYVWDVYEFGYTESGVTQPRWLSGNVGTGGTFAYYYEYQQRFNPPAADRDIWTVAVPWDGITSINNYEQPNFAGAYLGLTSPCTQTTTETLDVFYRIIWDNPDTVQSGMPNTRMYWLAARHAGANSPYPTYYPSYNLFFYHLTKALPFVDGQYITEAFTGVGSSGLGGIFGSTPRAGGSAYVDGSYRARIMTLTCDLTQLTGRVVGGVGHLRRWYETNSQTPFFNPLLRDSDSPVQNIFPHGSNATGPFYRSTEIAAGGGTVDVNGDAWTNPDWNKLLHVEITTSGQVATAEYKFHMNNLTGYKNNTYYPAPVGIACCTKSNSFDGQGWFQDGSGNFTNYNGMLASEYGTHPTRIALIKYDTFGWMDSITCERHRFYNGDGTAYDGTDVSQICVIPDRSNVGSLVPNDMWVADAATGLFRVHADASLVEKFDITHVDLTGLNSSECYGVTYTPGRIWAAFDGGLAYTADNGASFTVYNGASSPTFSVADFSRIWFIQGDPANADHRLAIAYNTEATPINRADYDIYWWDSVAGHGNVATNMYFGGTGEDPRLRSESYRSFSCSPDDGVWGCRAYNAQADQVSMFNYNATTHTHTYTTHGSTDERNRYWLAWTKDLNGDDAIHVVFWANDDTRYAICKQDGTRILSDRLRRSGTDNPLGVYGGWYAEGSGNQNLKCITAGGMMVGCTLRNNTSSGIEAWYMIPAWNDEDAPLGGEGYNILWKGYGWDGANWVEGNANSKVTHAAHEALIDGLTISFDDDSGAEQFFNTDHYTVGIVDGILVDAATEFDHSYALYYKPVEFDLSAVDNAGVLPATTQDTSYYFPEAARGTLIDASGVSVTGGGDYLDGTANNWYCRVNHTSDDVMDFRWRHDSGTGFAAGVTGNVGLCVSSKIGTAVTASNIDYSVRLSAGVVDGNSFRVEVVANGTVVHTIDDGTLRASGWGQFNRNNEDYVQIRLYRPAGSTDLQVIYRGATVYTFTGVTATLLPAVAYIGSNTSFMAVRLDTIGVKFTDYMIDLGDSGTNTGAFDPNFWAIDYTVPGRPGPDTIKINGVPATTVLVNDYVTPLAAGEVDLITYRGKIRFSAADIGKTLTIDRYNVILHE